MLKNPERDTVLHSQYGVFSSNTARLLTRGYSAAGRAAAACVALECSQQGLCVLLSE
jgi:hypothetical protein